MKTIRAFIAVALPAEVKSLLAATGRQLAASTGGAAVRWVKPEAIHLTLRFLGDTAVEQLPALGAVLDRVTAGRKLFNLKLGKLGCFPGPQRPRVIWADVTGGTAELQSLKADLDTLLAPLGWPPEAKLFQPHLTLGRIKAERAAVELPWGRPLEPLLVPVVAVHLYESQLRPAGPVYTVRHSSVLAG
jgi:RNA 2',3'-cyclic 3'-phosphodiesterase